MRIVSRHPARVIMVLAVAAVLALPGSTVAQRKFQLRVRPAAHHGLRHRRRRLRTIGYPWLSLQQATTGFFAYGVFIGMAAATRRRDHLFLSEITKRLPTTTRTAVEVFDRLVVLGVALAMVWFGCKNFLLDLGSFRMPSMIPLGTYTTSCRCRAR